MRFWKTAVLSLGIVAASTAPSVWAQGNCGGGG